MIPRAVACDDDRCDYDTAGWVHDPGCRYGRGLTGDADMAAATASEDGYSRAYGTAPQARAVRKGRAVTPLVMAHARAEQSGDPRAFMRAFGVATEATAANPDTESLILTAIRRDDPATAAGLIEGLAALHAAAGMPMHADPIYRRLPAGGTA